MLPDADPGDSRGRPPLSGFSTCSALPPTTLALPALCVLSRTQRCPQVRHPRGWEQSGDLLLDLETERGSNGACRQRMPDGTENVKGDQCAKDGDSPPTTLFPVRATRPDAGKGMLWKTFLRVGMEGIFDLKKKKKWDYWRAGQFSSMAVMTES